MSIKKKIGILSCKGGVGKSTLSVNITAMLSSFYFKRVALLDADVYGPNHPRFLGLLNHLYLNVCDNKFLLKKKFNLFSMSLGYLLKGNSSVLMRGPMTSNTLSYIYNRTYWKNLDFLIVDFPPGTGDIYLSTLRDIEFDYIFLVTTPNLVSLEDVRRSIYMLKKFNINVSGIIQNMSFHKCKSCDYIDSIYNSKIFFEELVKEYDFLKVYNLPTNNLISLSSNIGVPFVYYDFCYSFTLNLRNLCNDLI